MSDYEEPTIVSAPGFVGKTVFDPVSKKPVDKQIKVDERYITTEFGPLVLAPGEVLDVLDEKERGELQYIKVITDNPYANVYLELDDYRNAQTGETHAELLYDQRTTNAEGQFYIESDGTNGKGFPMVWNPQTNPSTYKGNIKIRISNPLRPSSNVYGFELNLRGRAGQPTPIQPLHIGGGSFTHAGLAGASLDLMGSAIANPVGATSGYSVDSTVNQSVFDTDGAVLAEGNLYAGRAGKPLFRRDSTSMPFEPNKARGVQKHNGVELLPAEAYSAALAPVVISIEAADNFPGSIDEPSTSTLTLTGDNAHLNDFAVGDRIFIRNGDTIHFPGEVATIVNVNNLCTMTVKPGVRVAFDDITFPHPQSPAGLANNEKICYGKVASFADISPDMVIKKVIVRRKRLVTYEG